MADLDPKDELIERLQAQLMQAQRLAALGELAGTLTHEFNNILTTTINYAKLALRNKDEASRDRALEKILAAGQRAARLTGSVLGLSRGTGDQFEPVDVAALIEDTLVLLERDLNKYRVSVVRQIEATPRVRANPNQLQQVLVNLLINARQAMPRGGTVTVQLKPSVGEALADLTVRDTGSGIPADQLPNIFEPYYTTKTPDAGGQGGTGIGLAACRKIVEAHRGRIRVESTVGRGTAFTIRLPFAEEAIQRQAG
jgi:signal transduction histidine kinase